MTTLPCKRVDFIAAAKELYFSLPALNKASIDSGMKCLTLLYLGINESGKASEATALMFVIKACNIRIRELSV